MKSALSIIVLCLFACGLMAQEANNLWKGNKAYEKRDYEKAGKYYDKSINLSPGTNASYNLANAYYRQKKYGEAAGLYEKAAKEYSDPKQRAEAYHNLGNSLLKANQLDKSIEAYKQSLRNNPADEDTRYNLSYALRMKQEEEKKDQKQDQNKDQENKEDQKQDKQENKDQKQEEEQQQKQPEDQKDEVSKEDAERLLENVENDEQKTQEKVRMMQRKKENKNIENDW